MIGNVIIVCVICCTILLCVSMLCDFKLNVTHIHKTEAPVQTESDKEELKKYQEQLDAERKSAEALIHNLHAFMLDDAEEEKPNG